MPMPAPVTPRSEPRPRLLSVVCPAFNEAASVAFTIDAVMRVLERLEQPFELVLVNDGSTDTTLAELHAIRGRVPATTIVDLSRNFGKEIAMTAGLDHARGDAVVILDADGQHPPETIAEMLEGWHVGYDVVYGVRRHRTDEGWLRRQTAQAFYRLVRQLGDIEMPENAGDFRLMSRKAVDAVISLREHHRFMKGVFAWVGFPSRAVAFDVAPRGAGTSSFNLWRLWNFSLEGLTSHTLAPLKASTYLGLAVALLAFLYGGYIVGKTLILGDPVPGFPTLVTLVLFLGGVQLVVLGIIGEYLGRVFNETKNRPLYFANVVAGRVVQQPSNRMKSAAGQSRGAQLDQRAVELTDDAGKDGGGTAAPH